MNKRQHDAFKYYTALAQSSDNLCERVGRPKELVFDERVIFREICDKLCIGKTGRIIDIGVGCGEGAKCWLNLAENSECEITLLDFPQVIEKIKKEFLPSYPRAIARVQLIDGIFPSEVSLSLIKQNYDYVVLYSVIHYIDKPRDIIDAAVKLLCPNGALLIGDIPNLNKKGRFLSTAFGRQFDAQYKQLYNMKQLPIYNGQLEFVRQAIAEGATPLTDDFILGVINDYRAKGFNVYVTEQPQDFPFYYTREDILIRAPHA